MPNAVSRVPMATVSWGDDKVYRVPAAIVAIYYPGQMMAINTLGNAVNCDDTAGIRFDGINALSDQLYVNSDDTLLTMAADQSKQVLVEKPSAFAMAIAAAALGDEGRAVYAVDDQTVGYTSTNLIQVGWVEQVLTTTSVRIRPIWLGSQGANKGLLTVAAATPTTLTKSAIGKTVLMPLTSSEAITLPAASTANPGEGITFINTSSNTSTPTLTAAGSDTINGAATYVQSTAQYSQVTLTSDGVSKWYVVTPGPSGSVGSTTFTGAVSVSSATLVVTDTVANTFAVGPNGATNPALTVDCSVGSAATGLSIQGEAAGSGVKLSVITSGTNEDLLVLPAGSGGVKVTSNGANSLAVGRQGSTSPTLQVDSSTSTCVTGMKLKSAASGSGFAVSFIGGTNEVVTVDTNGSGALTLQSIGTGNVLVGSGLLVNGGTGGVGYGTGVGGAQTQITSRTTGVTLNKLTGAITLVSAAGSATAFTFTVTNSTVAATDTIVANVKSSTDTYSVVVTTVAAGSFKLTVTDLTGTTVEQPVINFAVLKGVTS